MILSEKNKSPIFTKNISYLELNKTSLKIKYPYTEKKNSGKNSFNRKVKAFT